MHIVHESLCMQEYLRPENVQTVNLSKFLFQSRTRMLQVKTNFKNDHKSEDLNCPLKCPNVDDQKHLFQCDKIDAECIIGLDAPQYLDIFGNDVAKQMKVAAMLQTRMQKRRKMMTDKRN